ncbi:MAG: GEVED domain-containing protein [Candidatus Thermoplasmatota archaeon]
MRIDSINSVKYKASFVALMMLLTTMSTMITFFVTPVKAEGAQLWTTDEYETPKNDFSPGDIVYIHGIGFDPGSTVSISIERPDGWVDNAPGGRFPDTLPLVENDGSFIYTYTLDGIEGEYTIHATDGINQAEFTFTDWIVQLRVIYPNGGETVSGIINIRFFVDRWQSYDNTVYISYSKNGITGPWNQIGSLYVPSDGNYSIQWDTTQDVDGTNYYIRVRGRNNIGGWISDTSNSAFTIDNTPTRYDLGDAPAPYPTLLNSNGAWHLINPDVYLGLLVDAENDGQPSVNADGDDINPVGYPDDEDGVVFITPLTQGQTCIIEVTASTYGYLNAWVDFNADGEWGDSNDYIFQDRILSSGINTLAFSVPVDANVGYTYARFRFSTYGCISYIGGADNGEVEDYMVEIKQRDTTPPTQTIELGAPKREDVYYAGAPYGYLDMISSVTPIYINSTDTGSGSAFIRYYLFKRQVFNNSGSYEEVASGIIYDNQIGDNDPTPGRIAVIIYVNDSCWHEVDAYCRDAVGNGGWTSLDFLVDAHGPIVTKEINGPSCGMYISPSTIIQLNAADPIVGSEHCSVQCVKELHYVVTYPNMTSREFIVPGDSTSFTFNEECTHQLEFWAVDCLGNAGEHTRQTHYVDNSPPRTTKEYGYPKCDIQGQMYITSNTPIYLNATDNGPCNHSGQYTIHYRVWAHGVWTPWMHSGINTNFMLHMNDLGAPWNQSCIHYIEYYATDCLANTEYMHNQTFYVDNDGPVVEKTIGDPQRNFNGYNFVTTSTPIWLNATDTGVCAVGVKAIHYMVTYPNMTTGYFVVNGSSTMFTFREGCVHQLEFWAVDCLGNAGEHTRQTHYVDTEHPVSSSTYIPQAYTQNNWHYINNHTVKVITTEDRGCGVGGVGVKGVEWLVFNTTQGGNISALIANGTVFDNTQYLFYNGRVKVTGDNDPREGFVSINISILEDCMHSIWHRAFDYFGNYETFKKQNVKVDTLPPLVLKRIGEPKCAWNLPAGDYYVTRRTPIMIHATDNPANWPCNVSSVHMKIGIWYNNSWNYTWYNITNGEIYVNFTFDSAGVGNDCIHYVAFWAEDDIGNNVSDNETFYVDNTPPVTKKEYGYPKCETPNGLFITSDTPIFLNATDTGACAVGNYRIRYRVWYDGEWTDWRQGGLNQNVSFKMKEIYEDIGDPAEGCKHYIEYYAFDCLNNTEALHNQTFYVDDTPPVTIKQYGSPQCANQQGIFITSYTPIYLNATDPGCAVGNYVIYYRVWYNGSWTVWMNGGLNENVVLTMNDLGLPWNNDCIHYIEYYAVDCLGNTEIVHSQVFRVDNTPPATVKSFVGPTCGNDYWLKGKDTWIVLDSTDTVGPCMVGVDYLHVELWTASNGYDIDTLLWSVNVYDQDANDANNMIGYIQYRFQIMEDCLHEIRYYSVDKIGNKEVYTAEMVNLFYDDFGNDTDKWLTYRATRVNDSYSMNGYYMQIRAGPFGTQHGWIRTTIDTRGYEDIKVSFWARIYDVGSFDHLDIEYRVGSTGPWTLIGSINGETQWAFYTYSLGADANDKSEVKVRLRMVDGSGHSSYDYALIDNFKLTADTDMHTQQHRLDSMPPSIIKEVGMPSQYMGINEYGHDVWYVTTETEITLSAIDQLAPCAVGGEYLEYRIWYRGNWTGWMVYTEPIRFKHHCVHYLEIRAFDCLGNTVYDNETFIVHGPVEGVPTLKQPADGSLLKYKPVLVWNSVIGVDTYHLQIDDDIEFLDPVVDINVTGTSFDLIDTSLDDNTLYYWHVSSVYTGGTIGQYSDTWWFIVDLNPPVIEMVYTNDDDNIIVAGSSIIITVKAENNEAGLFGYLLFDNTQYGLVDNHDGTYSYTWCTHVNQEPGDYQVYAELIDLVGWSDSDDSLVITVISPAGPTTSCVEVHPDPSAPGELLTVTATIHSTISRITGAEYFIDVKGVFGTGTPMSPADGLWDSTMEDVIATIDTTGWVQGEYTVYVHGLDDGGRWGAFDKEEFTLVDNEPPCFDPLGLEGWHSGLVTISISNPAVDTKKVVFEYSPNEGGSWYPIATDYSMPFEVQWDTRSVTDGIGYQIKATAYDYSENTCSQIAEDIYIDNTGPTVAITSPEMWAVLFDTALITFTSEDTGIGVAQSFIRFNNESSWGPWMTATSPYEWDTRLVKDGFYTIEVKSVDLLDNEGNTDRIHVIVDNHDESDPFVRITELEPIDNGHILRVHVHAYDDRTSWEHLNVRVFVPGGRRNAPTIWSGDEHGEISEVKLGSVQDYYYADIEIFKYQNGSEITICADATDEAMNYKNAQPRSYIIKSVTVWDQWMQYGWNSLTLPPDGITGGSSTHSVLASINGKYNAVYWYNRATSSWVSRVYYNGTWLGSLTHLETGEEYWIQINATAGVRYYTDTSVPGVEILDPKDGEELTEGPEQVLIYAIDHETSIADVMVRIYDTTTGLYYQGVSWTSQETWHQCNYVGNDNWTFNTVDIWSDGHMYMITARAYDSAENTAEDTNTFTICPQPEFTSLVLQASIDQEEWYNVAGSLETGFNMLISPSVTFYYLNLKNPDTQTNVPLIEDYYGFTLDTTNLPAGFYQYWYDKGVYEGCTGTWQPIMWSIISGSQPMFYVKVNNAQEFMLIDGLQYLLGIGDRYLRVNGDYPTGTYIFNGKIMSTCGKPSEVITVKMMFTNEI